MPDSSYRLERSGEILSPLLSFTKERLGIKNFFMGVIIFSLLYCTSSSSQNYLNGKSTSYDDQVLKIIGADKIKYKINNSIKIGVIDIGIHRHPNITFTRVNTVTKESEEEHGTSVVGLLSAKKTSENQYEGLIPGIPIYVYELDEDLSTGQLSRGIDILTEYGVDIINISLSTSKNDELVIASLKNAVNRGVVIVASSGNSGLKEDLYPASYDIPGVISVSAIDDQLNILKIATVNTSVDIFAPGENITSLSKNISENKKYNGTSLATVFVTYLCALLKNENKQLQPSKIESIIENTATEYRGTWLLSEHMIKLMNVENSIKEAREAK